MKIYKIELTVIDFHDVGVHGVCDILENTNYPNDCISPNVLSSRVADIGEWGDDHPLNHSGTAESEIERLFGD
jgi:hypothetical protein